MIVVNSLFSRLREGWGRMVRMFRDMGATQPIGIFLPPPSRKSTQLGGFDIFNSSHYRPCNGSPPVPPYSPSICLSHHCLDGWSAGTGCAAFPLSTSSFHPAISSSCTQDYFSQSFHLPKYMNRHSIYFWPATAPTSHSSTSSDCCSCIVLGLSISRVPSTAPMRVKNIFS